MENLFPAEQPGICECLFRDNEKDISIDTRAYRPWHKDYNACTVCARKIIRFNMKEKSK